MLRVHPNALSENFIYFLVGGGGGVRVSRKNKLLESCVLFKFIDVDSCLQLIMRVFPM